MAHLRQLLRPFFCLCDPRKTKPREIGDNLMTYPKCFDSESQYKTWEEAKRQAREYANYCTDCNPEYQKQMKSQGRCMFPKVRFVERLSDESCMGLRGEGVEYKPYNPTKAQLDARKRTEMAFLGIYGVNQKVYESEKGSKEFKAILPHGRSFQDFEKFR